MRLSKEFIKELEEDCKRLEYGINLIKSNWSLKKKDENKTDYNKLRKNKLYWARREKKNTPYLNKFT